MSKKDAFRVQFDFSPDALARLDHIKSATEASTRAEVVRNALKLYEWMSTQVDHGHTLEVHDTEGNLVYRIPLQTLLS